MSLLRTAILNNQETRNIEELTRLLNLDSSASKIEKPGILVLKDGREIEVHYRKFEFDQKNAELNTLKPAITIILMLREKGLEHNISANKPKEVTNHYQAKDYFIYVPEGYFDKSAAMDISFSEYEPLKQDSKKLIIENMLLNIEKQFKRTLEITMIY